MNRKKLLLFPTCVISCMAAAQTTSVTASGRVTDNKKAGVPYASIILKKEKDSAFVAGTITNEEGRFSITGIKPDHYLLVTSINGYHTAR
ncbi:MAG TPA: TonB-dependent receptor, partial [Chryseobacterium indologenes]|nr:TonB-dependent receptor [Chryseobacterium indologenes]